MLIDTFLLFTTWYYTTLDVVPNIDSAKKNALQSAKEAKVRPVRFLNSLRKNAVDL